MLRCMLRTNIYLTEEQARALDARARAAGTTRSGELRGILDDALTLGNDASGDRLDTAFAELADGYTRATERLFDDDYDLRIS